MPEAIADRTYSGKFLWAGLDPHAETTDVFAEEGTETLAVDVDNLSSTNAT